MTTRDIVVADEIAWRQVKAPSGLYVHKPETHTYPGADCWHEALCATGDHRLCMRSRAVVDCDEGCGAFQEPETLDEYKAALEHWMSHHYLHGCSHG